MRGLFRKAAYISEILSQDSVGSPNGKSEGMSMQRVVQIRDKSYVAKERYFANSMIFITSEIERVFRIDVASYCFNALGNGIRLWHCVLYNILLLYYINVNLHNIISARYNISIIKLFHNRERKIIVINIHAENLECDIVAVVTVAKRSGVLQYQHQTKRIIIVSYITICT